MIKIHFFFSDFPAITICNQNRIKRSTLNHTRFSPLVDIDDRIAADVLEQNQAVSSRRRRSLELAPHSNVTAFDYSKFIKSAGNSTQEAPLSPIYLHTKTKGY